MDSIGKTLSSQWKNCDESVERPIRSCIARFNVMSFVFSFYRLLIGPFMRAVAGPSAGCRFEPSCSHYSEQAFREFGLFKGGLLSVKRIVRCNPWTQADFFDPVPPKQGRAIKGNK